jgi:hypothetical protein
MFRIRAFNVTGFPTFAAPSRTIDSLNTGKLFRAS